MTKKPKAPRTTVHKANKRTRRAPLRSPKDRDTGKKCSNGLAHTFRAIQEYWFEAFEEGERLPRMDAGRFSALPEVQEAFLAAKDRYPGIGQFPNAPRSIEKHVRKLSNGESYVPYFDLRCFADLTGLRPAGLLLFFTQLVGEERRAGTNARKRCLELIGGAIAVLQGAQKHVESKGECESLFLRTYEPGVTEPLPDIDIIRAWALAFNTHVTSETSSSNPK